MPRITPRHPRRRSSILLLVALSLTLTGALGWLTFSSASAAFNGKDHQSSANSIGDSLARLAHNSAMAKYFGGFSMMQQAPSCTPPPANMVAWYPEDGYINDIQGSNNPSATNAIGFVTGKVGQGVTFGTGGYIDIPDTPALDNQQFTVDAWVRPDGAGPNDTSVILQKNINTFNGFQSSLEVLWRPSDSRFLVGVYGNSAVSTNTFPTGQFYHVTGTYDGATIKLYVNGVLEGQQAYTTTIVYDNTPFTIGSNFKGFSDINFARTWTGVIDELEIFNRALSPTEIQLIVNAGSAG